MISTQTLTAAAGNTHDLKGAGRHEVSTLEDFLCLFFKPSTTRQADNSGHGALFQYPQTFVVTEFLDRERSA